MKCVLGFDGGGTKTECVVMNEAGKIAGRATGPADSDEGSAFDIGRAAVSAARFAETTESIELARQILRHLGAANWDELDSIAAAHADAVYPRVFPVIAAAADSGNQLAQSLLHAAAEKLSSMASHLSEELNLLQQVFPLGKTGGTIARSPSLPPPLTRPLFLNTHP